MHALDRGGQRISGHGPGVKGALDRRGEELEDLATTPATFAAQWPGLPRAVFHVGVSIRRASRDEQQVRRDARFETRIVRACGDRRRGLLPSMPDDKGKDVTPSTSNLYRRRGLHEASGRSA